MRTTNKTIEIQKEQVIAAMRDLIEVKRDGSDTYRIGREINDKRVKADRISTSTVYRRLQALQREGRVKRVGNRFYPYFGWSLQE